MATFVHQHDLPDHVSFQNSVAIDTEAMGLVNHRDRLCLIQLSAGDGSAHIVQFKNDYSAPNLKKLFADHSITKIFHFARFDLAIIRYYLDIWAYPCYCTKIASRLVRTYTEHHGLKELCSELLGVKINKYQQSSDWGQDTLTSEQIDYAASDVLYLHKIQAKLDVMVKREGREKLAQACFEFLCAKADLDLLGWDEVDIFSHNTHT